MPSARIWAHLEVEMTPQDIEAIFTRSDGRFAFARWGRPIAPVVFGVDDATLAVVKGAVEATCQLVRQPIVETDPELGSNLMMFFFREWAELGGVPGLDQLVPDMGPLVERLQAVGANQYRLFRFDAAGAINACFVFLRMDEQLSALPAETLALGQVVQSLLLWSDVAFRDVSPLAKHEGNTVLRPDVADLLRAAYDPVLPAAAQETSHALRLFARMGGTS